MTRMSRSSLLQQKKRSQVDLELDNYGFSPWLGILMGLVKHLAKEDTERQIQKKRHTKEPYWQELDRPIFEPPFKSLLKVC